MIGPLTCGALFVMSRAVAAQQIRDSAGIHITFSARPAWSSATAWKLAPTSEFDIGRSDGPLEYQLQDVMSAVRLTSGVIVIANMSTSELRYYDRAGRFMRAVGRRGGGPAEFSQLMGAAVIAGDTIIGDNSHRGWETFTAVGKHVRSVRTVGAFVASWFDDGTGIADQLGLRSRPPATGSRWTDSATYVHVDRTGKLLNVIASLPMQEQTRVSGRAMPVEFGPELALTSARPQLFAAFSNEYSIRVLTAAGTVERIIRRAWTPHTISKAERDEFVQTYTNPARESLEPGAAPSGIRALRLRNVEAMTFAPTLPAFRQMIADRHGNLWVRDAMTSDYSPRGGFGYVPDSATRWSVFDPTGRWLGELTMPRRFRAMSIDAEYVIGLYRDEDDVEHVRGYRVMKGNSR